VEETATARAIYRPKPLDSLHPFLSLHFGRFLMRSALGSSGLLTGLRMLSTGAKPKVLNVQYMNKHLREAEYAVRGELPIKAEKYKTELAKGAKLPFDEVIYCNIGNPQQLNQKPITFFRQVASLLEVPELLEPSKRPLVEKLYAPDAIQRASILRDHIGSIGAYSHSQGIAYVRQTVANFIQARDGFPSNPDHIFLTAGASEGVKLCLNILIENENTGVMIPIPQYPLYSASLTAFGGKGVPYPLDEENEWGLSVSALKTSLEQARSQGTNVKALVVINPGNPTGQCLTAENIREIVDFAQKEGLVVFADEVYQVNVYQPDRPFHSFKKIASQNKIDVELISFHSISKGVIGECGRRGGYFECFHIDADIIAQMYKISSISLCPSVQGQVMMDLMVNPPKLGDPSYQQYHEETTSIYDQLKRRSQKLVAAFNRMEGVSCNTAQGAMYAFPQIRLPKKAVEAAKAAGKVPDVFYCLAMLDATGVCVVPGSGFGQKDGTWHFRATFLPPEEKFDAFISRLDKFHKEFMNKYRD